MGTLFLYAKYNKYRLELKIINYWGTDFYVNKLYAYQLDSYSLTELRRILAYQIK